MDVDDDSSSTLFGRRSPWSDASVDHFSDIFDERKSYSDWNESDTESDEEQLSFQDQLATLFIDLKLEQSKGTAILKLLRKHPCFSYLPADHRTLVATPQETIELKKVEPGEYLHLGVEKQIINYLRESGISVLPEYLYIDFSTDGANLDEKGFITLWPLLGRIVNIPNSTPILFGVYKGRQKPADADKFMEDFVNETNEILTNGGILYENRRIPIVLRCFIADAPARAMILNHKYPTGYNSCSKCDPAGNPRTDEDYRSQKDEEHHHGPSAIETLPIDLVQQVTFDWLHLTLLGAAKRQTWATVKGAPDISKDVKLRAYDLDVINARLFMCRSYCPREFSRLPGRITDWERMKGTEFRQLLLYTGPVIYHGIYRKDVYDHYLLHHTALRCLVAPKQTPALQEYARTALKEWQVSAIEIYGPRFNSYNIKAQHHLVDDVENFGPLDSQSAFIYENYMRILRSMCNKPDAPLQQIYRRVIEKANRKRCQIRKPLEASEVKASQNHNNGPLLRIRENQNLLQHKLIQTANFTLGTNTHDNCCILTDSSICIVRNIVSSGHGTEKNYHLIVNKFDDVESWFNTGIESRVVGSFKCFNLNPRLTSIKLKKVAAKCYRMPYWSLPAQSELPSIQPLENTYIVTVMMHAHD